MNKEKYRLYALQHEDCFKIISDYLPELQPYIDAGRLAIIRTYTVKKHWWSKRKIVGYQCKWI